MKILVIGGSGFVGGAIVRYLEAKGYSVDIFGLHPPKYVTSAKMIYGNILEEEDISKLGRYDLVFHMAGVLGTSITFKDVRKTEITNVIGTLNVLDMMSGKGRVIQPNLLGTWLNPYMISKRTAERYGLMYRQETGLDYISVRLTDVYGPGQSTSHGKAVPTFINQALNGENITVYGTGAYHMRLLYVDDAAKILAEIGLSATGLESVLQVGTIQPSNHISVLRLAQRIKRLCNSDSKIVHKPMRKGQPKDIVYYDFDKQQGAAALSKYGVEEISLTKGLKNAIADYRTPAREYA